MKRHWKNGRYEKETGFMLFLFVPLGIIVHLGYFTYSYFSSDLKEREKWYISPGQSIGGFFCGMSAGDAVYWGIIIF